MRPRLGARNSTIQTVVPARRGTEPARVIRTWGAPKPVRLRCGMPLNNAFPYRARLRESGRAPLDSPVSNCFRYTLAYEISATLIGLQPSLSGWKGARSERAAGPIQLLRCSSPARIQPVRKCQLWIGGPWPRCRGPWLPRAVALMIVRPKECQADWGRLAISLTLTSKRNNRQHG